MASLARPTAGRALHLRITPRPSSLGESREILRLISQFGEVEYFRNLKYDALSMPNASLVIFQDEEAALHCVRKSPIRFRMGKAPAPGSTAADAPDLSPSSAEPGDSAAATPPPPPPTPAPPPRPRGAWGLGQTRAMSTSPSYTALDRLPKPPARPLQMPFEPPPLPLVESRTFQIQARPARAHFQDQIDVGHYHGSFLLDTKSVAQMDLSQTVPLPGLSCIDWKKPDKPWRVMNKQRAQERKGRWRRKSLQELYEEAAPGKAAARTAAVPG